MANTYVDSIATASQTDFAFSFSYLKAEHVKVEINGVDTAAFTLVTSPSNKVVLNSGATAGQVVRVRRNSQPDTNLVDFVNGSVLTETELDFAYQHNRFLNEELAELNEASLQIGPGGTDWDAKSNKILNVSTPTLTADAATKNYVDQKVEQIAAGASTPPSKWQFTGIAGANTTYTVTDADVLGDSAYDVSVNGLVKEPTVDYTVDPDTDTLTIIPSLAGGEDIVIIQRGLGIPLTQGTIGTAQINNDAITSDKILDGSVTNAKLATPYSHPNHTGDVTSTGDGATVITDNTVTAAKISDTDNQFSVDDTSTQKTVIINNSSGDVDFIVKSTGNGNLIVTDGANNAVGIGTTTNTNFALTASNAAIGTSLVVYEPTGSSTEGGQININKAGVSTPSSTESDGFVIDAYDTGATGNYGLAADTDVLRIIGTPGSGADEKSIVITEDADVITNGDIKFRAAGANNIGEAGIEAGQVHSQLLVLKDGVTAPSTFSGQAAIYVDSADGDLKIKFSDGTVKTIVTDS